MAPSRRRAADKAAAAAAARRKWKVGDLCLAKIKGFPAWPAAVTEQDKVGYTADSKKIVVRFFGSDQIGFCNPADVEEFTEEKKVSLLGKRHGSDFVRAVHEIIDCFEKLKKQEQVDRASGAEETNITNENNPKRSLNKSTKVSARGIADEPHSAGTTHDLNSLTEAAVAAAAEDALHDDEEMQWVEAEAPSSLVFPETPVSCTYMTRNKVGAARLRNSGLQRRKSTRRLRSSSRSGTRSQGTISNTRSSRRSGANALQDRSLRRSRRRIVKSSDDSEGEDADSLSLASNDSIEESDSEMMALDSDAVSINHGRAINFASKTVGAEESFSENNEGETELSDRLDFQSSNVIVKKKRKPTRKRHNNDIVELAKLDAVVTSDAEVLKTDCASPNFSEKSAQRHAKNDGDEHLPLVKRARVRMGRPSPAADEEVTLAHNKEVNKSEVQESLPVQSSKPLSCMVGSPAEKESIPIKDDPAPSVSYASPPKKPQLWEIRKSFVDVEAALPPSKRLHRALEAMSANVAEDWQSVSDSSPAANTQSNGHCSSLECSEPLTMDSELCTVSKADTSENVAKTVSVVSNCGSNQNFDSIKPGLCGDLFELAEGADGESLKISVSSEVPAEIVSQHSLEADSVDIREQLPHSDCNAPILMISSTNHFKDERMETEGSDPVISNMNSNSIAEDIAVGSPNVYSCDKLGGTDGGGDETHKTTQLLLVENNHGSNMSDFPKEAKPQSLNSNMRLSVSPMKVFSSGDHRSLFHSTSVSYGHVEDRTVSATQSSSPTDRPDSVAMASPLTTSACNRSSLLDNNRSLENTSCSPDVQLHLHLEKAKAAGRSSSKDESLSSFEAIIKSLTRTKECIGRATRIAIDCAKSGFATKVVEILACNLESESSLHKKVDLFFLVDSITQCSRGIKGDGGVYPSAIQALLPRLLLAAAPPGSSSRENHRQCLKVLRVWQERKIIPEPIIRHHIRELDALCGSYPIVGSNRPLRNERAIDDPIREMEGMLVDEYGSNSSIQLPGFCMPPMLRDDEGGCDSDGESFEAVTPEHNFENLGGENMQVKRGHILEDVDGELEMEDVAPSCSVEIPSASNVAGADHTTFAHHASDKNHGPPYSPHPPMDVPQPSARLPGSSLPPPAPPPPPVTSHHPLQPSVFPPSIPRFDSNGPNTKFYPGSQSFNNNSQESRTKQPVLRRDKPGPLDTAHHRVHRNKDFEAQMPKQIPTSNNACSFSDRHTSRSSGRASNGVQPSDAFNKGFHLRPPHPAPSNQFSYVQEHRVQSRRDLPPPSHPSRFYGRNTDNGNFYRDRDRSKFVTRDDIGQCWRPPFSSISGPCYPDGDGLAYAPMDNSGPPRVPDLPSNRWNYPPRPMNHNRHVNPYRPHPGGPIPVANRGPNFWRPK